MHTFTERIKEEEKKTLKLLEGSDWGWFDVDEVFNLNIPKSNNETLNLLKDYLENENKQMSKVQK